MEKLGRSTNLLEISVNKYDDLLILDCSDMQIFKRFTSLYDNIEKIAKEAEREVTELKNKYRSRETEGISIDEVTDYVDVSICISRKIMNELDGVFGKQFTQNVFRENYELNPDFVPDEIALADTIEAMIPIMEKAYGERISRNKNKYSATKRGKHKGQ